MNNDDFGKGCIVAVGISLLFIIPALQCSRQSGSSSGPSAADKAQREWKKKRDRDNQDIETLYKAAKQNDENK